MYIDCEPIIHLNPNTMAVIIASHPVADYAAWRPIYDADTERRKVNGIKTLAVGQKSDDPNMIYMIWEVEDASTIEKMMADPSLQEKMKEAGVTGPPEFVTIN